MTPALKHQFAEFRQQARLGYRNKQDRDGEQMAIIALLNVCTSLTAEVEVLAHEVAALKAEKVAAGERMAKARAARGAK